MLGNIKHIFIFNRKMHIDVFLTQVKPYIRQTSLATDDATQSSWVEMLPPFAIVISILMIS